jgi:hypothetical protein
MNTRDNAGSIPAVSTTEQKKGPKLAWGLFSFVRAVSASCATYFKTTTIPP